MGDGLRLALTTLTVAPVAGPGRLDPAVAGRAMLWAPAVGLGLGLAAAAVLLAGRTATGGRALGSLLAAVATVAALAWATRGLHLDGLADTADGLGSARPAEGALEVMRRSDTGPFGVVTLVLVLLGQAVALAACVLAGRGSEAVVLAAVTSRVAVVMGTTRGVPAARGSGLGAAVAGTAPRWGWPTWALAVVGAAAVWGWFDEDGRAAGSLLAVVAVGAGLGAARLLLRRCVRRLGGVTGDVLGALVETATTAVLVVLALRPGG